MEKSVLRSPDHSSECWLSRIFFIIIILYIFHLFLRTTEHTNSIETILIDLDLPNHWELFVPPLLCLLLLVIVHRPPRNVPVLLCCCPAATSVKETTTKSKNIASGAFARMHPSKIWWSRNVHKHYNFFPLCISANAATLSLSSSSSAAASATTTAAEEEEGRQTEPRDLCGGVWCKDTVCKVHRRPRER